MAIVTELSLKEDEDFINVSLFNTEYCFGIGSSSLPLI
jgi:hypothetical protein